MTAWLTGCCVARSSVN